MQTIDQSVLKFFVGMRVEWLTFVMLTITYLGNAVMVSVLTLLSGLSFYIHKHYTRILPLLISVGGTTLTTYVLKSLVNRPRPWAIVYPEFTSSFPSYHAAAAVALYGFFLFTIWKHDKHYIKKSFMIFLFLIIILIGVSRLYLGEHYFSDVWVGYTIGAIWLFIGAKLHHWLLRWEFFKNKLQNNF
jgi:undecaprenyl-diphosphatase